MTWKCPSCQHLDFHSARVIVRTTACRISSLFSALPAGFLPLPAALPPLCDMTGDMRWVGRMFFLLEEVGDYGDMVVDYQVDIRMCILGLAWWEM